jgi:hypothetical protein
MSLWWPVDNPRVTGEWANSPSFYAKYGMKGHNGIDLGMPTGTPVFASDAGVVQFEGWGQNNSWMGTPAGICVLLRHPWGYTGYAHMSSTIINNGQSVTKGQLLGYSGNTGASTGPHLHWETLPPNPDFRNGFAGRVNPHNYGVVARGTTATPTPPAVAANQRTSGSQPVNRRLDPNTSRPPIDPQLAPNTVGDFDGWVRGETVEGNNIWFRGAHSGNWFWSGGFTSQSTAGLTDLNPVTPPTPPTPEPVPPTPEPTPEPTRKPVSETTPNWDASAPTVNPVYPRPEPKPTGVVLPDVITQRTEAVSVNGYTIGRPDPHGPNHIVLHHAASTSMSGVVNTLRGTSGAPTANYVVGENELVEMVPERDSAWTNGRWTSNMYSITFEMLNASGSSATGWFPPSEKTMETTAWAMARAAQRWNIETPLEYGVNVFGHRDVSKTGTACPGALNIQAVVKRANEIMNANSVPSPTPSPQVDVAAIAEHLDAISTILKASM